MDFYLEIEQRLKKAIKAREAMEMALLRMIKSRFQLKMSEKGQLGPLDEKTALQIIATYSKQISKALPDFLKAGEKGAEKANQIKYEIEYLSQFLPKKLSEADTEALVKQKIADLGVSSMKEMGKLMGMIMKNHKDEVDAGLVKNIAAKLLSE